MYTSALLYPACRGIENIQAGIGVQAGNFLKDITIFVIGIVWAFFISWKLALVLLTLFPIVSFLGGLSISVRLPYLLV